MSIERSRAPHGSLEDGLPPSTAYQQYAELDRSFWFSINQLRVTTLTEGGAEYEEFGWGFEEGYPEGAILDPPGASDSRPENTDLTGLPPLPESPGERPPSMTPWDALDNGDPLPLPELFPTEGVLVCREHRSHVLVGESGPDERVGGTFGVCGCDIFGPGNHVIPADRIYVQTWGRQWWWQGRPTTEEDVPSIIRWVHGQDPLDSRRSSPATSIGRASNDSETEPSDQSESESDRLPERVEGASGSDVEGHVFGSGGENAISASPPPARNEGRLRNRGRQGVHRNRTRGERAPQVPSIHSSSPSRAENRTEDQTSTVIRGMSRQIRSMLGRIADLERDMERRDRDLLSLIRSGEASLESRLRQAYGLQQAGSSTLGASGSSAGPASGAHIATGSQGPTHTTSGSRIISTVVRY